MVKTYADANNRMGLTLVCRTISKRVYGNNARIKSSRYLSKAGLIVPGMSGYVPIQALKCENSEGDTIYATKGSKENSVYVLELVDQFVHSATFKLDESFEGDV